MTNRQSSTRAFLVLAVLVGGPLLGAKLFDLLVLAGAWSAHPPSSLAMMPYGKAWPVDTGVFFIPFSAIMLTAGFGALVAGWRTPWRYRWLLCLPSVGILLLLILTVVAFWPMNAALYYHGIGSPKNTITDEQSIAMAHRWLMLDWIRVAGATAAFVAPLRALMIPWPQETAPRDPRWCGSCSYSLWVEWRHSSSGSSRTFDGHDELVGPTGKGPRCGHSRPVFGCPSSAARSCWPRG